jgi:hypothetical protein
MFCKGEGKAMPNLPDPIISFGIVFLLVGASACVARKTNDALTQSERITSQKEELSADCVEFQKARVNSVFSKTLDATTAQRDVTDGYLKNFLEANFLFPQDNQAIRIFSLHFALHDPDFDFAEDLKGINVSDEQLTSFAKSVSLGHQRCGVKKSTERYPLEDNPENIKDSRLIALIRGSIRRTRRDLAASRESMFYSFSDSDKHAAVIRNREWTQTITPELCRFVALLTAMKNAYRSPRLVDLDREWKRGITSPEITAETRIFGMAELFKKFRPLLIEAILAELNKKPLTEPDRYQVHRIWEAVTNDLISTAPWLW